MGARLERRRRVYDDPAEAERFVAQIDHAGGVRPAAVARAAAAAAAAGAGPLVERLRGWRRGLLAAFLALAAVLGVATAWTGLAAGDLGPAATQQPGGAELNVVLFLAATLGPHTVLLALSAGLLCVQLLRRRTVGVYARAGDWLGARLAGGRRGAAHAAGHRGDGGHDTHAARRADTALATEAALAELHRGRRAAWITGVVSNLGGLGFALGALAAVLVSTSFREHYDFFYKTSLLTTEQASGLIHAVSSPLERLGVETPTADDVAAARYTGDAAIATDPDAQRRWSRMLIGAVAVYAVVPRAVLLLISAAGLGLLDRFRTPASALPEGWDAELGRRAGAARALAVERARAEPRRERAPTPRRQGAPGTRPAPAPPAGTEHAGGVPAPPGPPAVLWYETDRPGAGWPPPALRGATDLGTIDGFVQRRDALARLRALSPEPGAVVAVMNRSAAPTASDRGFIAELVETAGQRAAVVLDLGPGLDVTDPKHRERIALRTTQWREAAAGAGLPGGRVLELDLGRLTGSYDAAFERLLASDNATPGTPPALAPAPAPTPTLRRAFDRIADTFDHAPAEPGKDELKSLAQDIGELYGGQTRWLPKITSLADAKDAAAGASRRLLTLLPESVRLRHPGWTTAGGLSGVLLTLGGAAAIGGPVGLAIAAGLTPWIAGGAGLVGGELAGRATQREPRDDGAALARADALRAAALHAMALDLQGLPDAEISRMLATTIDAIERAEVSTADHRAWLDALHRHLTAAAV